MEICKICNKETKSLQSLGSHVKRAHNICGEDYYLRYIGSKGICICGTPTKFLGLGAGYRKYCSNACAYHDPDVVNKRESTMMNRYGAITVGASEDIQIKIRNVLRNKYGVDNVSKLQIVKDKIKYTNELKYGVSYAFNTDIAKTTRHNNRITEMKTKYLHELVNFNCELIDTINDVDDNTIVKYQCHNCNSIMNESWQFFVLCRLDRNYTPCINCLPKPTGTSFHENDIAEYIKSLGVDIKRNVRDIIPPRELDILIPELNIAIEFNGLYFHSELYKDSLYHYSKTNDCIKKGIHLIHIYEDDWCNKQDIVKSRICNLLNISTRIYARKCVVKSVNSLDCNLFLDANHIQGKCRSMYRYGLYHNDELISIMTFGKSRFSDEFELIRFCNNLNTTVVGGASKLFSYFINHNSINSVISYADRSWSLGNLYKQLGFEFDSITNVGYSYINDNTNTRENRIKFQKHKLVAEGYDKNMTEHEIMLSRKIYRIYDSGHLKYIWIRR